MERHQVGKIILVLTFCFLLQWSESQIVVIKNDFMSVSYVDTLINISPDGSLYLTELDHYYFEKYGLNHSKDEHIRLMKNEIDRLTKSNDALQQQLTGNSCRETRNLMRKQIADQSVYLIQFQHTIQNIGKDSTYIHNR